MRTANGIFSPINGILAALGDVPFLPAPENTPRFGASKPEPVAPTYAVRLIGLHNSRCRLHKFTEYRRVLLRCPIPDRAKNGVFCSVLTPTSPRAGETAGRRIILVPDIVGMTHLCSGKRRNLAQNARQGHPKVTVDDVESYAGNQNCRILQKMHGAPHGTHCRMAENRPSAPSRCIPEEIKFDLAVGHDKQKDPERCLLGALGSHRSSVRCVCYLRLPPPSPGRRELPPRLPPRLLP